MIAAGQFVECAELVVDLICRCAGCDGSGWRDIAILVRHNPVHEVRDVAKGADGLDAIAVIVGCSSRLGGSRDRIAVGLVLIAQVSQCSKDTRSIHTYQVDNADNLHCG